MLIPRNKVGIALALVLLGVSGASAQEPNDAPAPTHRPFTATLADLKTDRGKLRPTAETARLKAIEDLKALGGTAAARVSKLTSLSTPRFFEQLAINPPAGPSAIAAPKPGASVPSPSVNWVGAAGGATVGDPGVVLLLAKQDGSDTFNVYCTGTLIRQNVILSATHCVCYSPQATANYPTGQYCLNGDANTTRAPLLEPTRWRAFFQHVGLRQIKAVEINDQYEFDNNVVRNDLAVFVLSRAVGEINPPNMPAATDLPSTWATGSIVGFGYSANPNAPNPSILQQLVLPGLKAEGQVNSAVCTTEGYLDPASSLCSIYVPAGQGSEATVCSGDSGGPLWLVDSSGTEIGVTSGRNDADCAAPHTLGFQMFTGHRSYRTWIDANLQKYASPSVMGRWPAFGQNLRFVLDKRNVQVFDDSGSYQSDGWMSVMDASPVLGTINSSGRITHFELQDRTGMTLCQGSAGAAKNIPNVDYCVATNLSPASQFHVVARGTPNESLQFVVTTHAAGTSFAE